MSFKCLCSLVRSLLTLHLDMSEVVLSLVRLYAALFRRVGLSREVRGGRKGDLVKDIWKQAVGGSKSR